MFAASQPALYWLRKEGQTWVGSWTWPAVPTRKVEAQTLGLGEYCSWIIGNHKRVRNRTLIMVSQPGKQWIFILLTMKMIWSNSTVNKITQNLLNQTIIQLTVILEYLNGPVHLISNTWTADAWLRVDLFLRQRRDCWRVLTTGIGFFCGLFYLSYLLWVQLMV